VSTGSMAWVISFRGPSKSGIKNLGARANVPNFYNVSSNPPGAMTVHRKSRSAIQWL
jgi:hypothetical protein